MTNAPLVDKLKAEGVAYLPGPHEAHFDSNAKNLARKWRMFLHLPDDVKERFSIDADTPDPDNGYIIRTGGEKPEGGVYDPDKRFFHYRKNQFTSQKIITLLNDLTPDQQSICFGLIVACSVFFIELNTLYETFLDVISKKEKKKINNHPLSVLRLLEYGTSSNSNGELAQTHLDKSFLTIHIADSHPGLVYEDTSGNQIPYERTDENILLFFGKKAEQFGFRPLPHGVKPNPQYKTERRWSIVFFGHI